MKFTSNLKLRDRLILIVLLPLAGFVSFSIDSLLERRSVANEMEKLEILAELSVKIGSLAHEFQKERGMTAGFLGSEGARFAGELPLQRQESDKKVGELRSNLNNLDINRFDAQMKDSLAKAVKSMGELNTRRNAISSLTMTSQDAFDYYTNVIGMLLSVPAQAATLSSNAEISRSYSAYAGSGLLPG